jgi:hypothetical protein
MSPVLETWETATPMTQIESGVEIDGINPGSNGLGWFHSNVWVGGQAGGPVNHCDDSD